MSAALGHPASGHAGEQPGVHVHTMGQSPRHRVFCSEHPDCEEGDLLRDLETAGSGASLVDLISPVCRDGRLLDGLAPSCT